MHDFLIFLAVTVFIFVHLTIGITISLENRSPDFVKFADAFGLKGRRVTQPSELEEAITEALAESAQGRGYVIDCAINADEMVHPMVNGGHHITEFLLS